MINKIILMLLFLFYSCPLNARALQNKNWFNKENLTKPITFVINGEELDLDKDLDRIIEYYNDKPYDFYFLPIKKTIKNKQEICAKNIKDDIYLLRDSVDKPIKLPHNLTWSENPFQDRNWEFWFQSWLFTDCLLDGYTIFNDKWYLQRTKSLVMDWWIDNFKATYPSKEFSWYDHTIPKRLEEFLRIFEFLRRNDALDEKYTKIALRAIYWHARILSEEKSLYMKNHNHGLDQATALFKTSQLFPEYSLSQQWETTARNRLTNQINFALTSEGVHKENSPSYYMWVSNRCSGINKFSEHYTGSTITDNFSILKKGSQEFIAAITRPDNTFPQLGDTAPYIKGKQGKCTNKTTSVFPKSGYFIYRDKWDNPGENTAIHLVMKCGYLSRTHRHNDDGNILLYGLGEDWLIDAGMYGYENNKYRAYVGSPSAHNISFPSSSKLNSSEILSWKEKEKLDKKDWGITVSTSSHVTCKSYMFKDYKYSRILNIIGRNSFSISDQLSFNNSISHTFKTGSKTFVTLFKVPDNKEVYININKKTILIVNKDKSAALKISYFNKSSKIRLFRGESGDIMSFQTVGYLKVVPAKTIAFITEVDSDMYFADFNLELISSPILEDYQVLPLNYKKKRISAQNTTTDIIDFIINPDKKDVKIAFYLYKDDKRIDTQWYSKNFTYKFDKRKYQDGKYRIRYFVVDASSDNPGKAKKLETGFSEYIMVEKNYEK